MYDTLLFFHVLSAFALAAAIVMFTAYTHGVAPTSGAFSLAARLEDVGGLGTLALGIWLAIDEYSITDGWIIAAIVIWMAAGGFGNAYRQAVQPVLSGATAGTAVDVSGVARAAAFHWLRTGFFVLLLADMIWKPGA